jgi:hypothetical protein
MMMWHAGKKAKNPKAVIPWASITKDPNYFFDSQYLPDGLKLVEISKMRGEHLHSCLQRWRKIQEKGEQAFCFKQVASGHEREVGKKRKRSEASKAKLNGDLPQSGPEDLSHGKHKANAIMMYVILLSFHIIES